MIELRAGVQNTSRSDRRRPRIRWPG